MESHWYKKEKTISCAILRGFSLFSLSCNTSRLSQDDGGNFVEGCISNGTRAPMVGWMDGWMDGCHPTCLLYLVLVNWIQMQRTTCLHLRRKIIWSHICWGKLNNSKRKFWFWGIQKLNGNYIEVWKLLYMFIARYFFIRCWSIPSNGCLWHPFRTTTMPPTPHFFTEIEKIQRKIFRKYFLFQQMFLFGAK